MRRRLSLLIILAACKRDAPVATTDAPSTAEPNASSSPVSSYPAATVADAEPPPAARTETKSEGDLTPPAEADSENPLKKIGKVVVWAVAEGEGTRLVAKSGNDKPKLLRKTSGKVRAIDALIVGDDVVVAWASELAAGGTQLVALVTASIDLGRVTAPTTVAMVAAPIQEEAHVAIAKNPHGGFIVVHQGPQAKCVLLEQPTECVTFEVKAISAAGAVTKLASEKLHGGPSPEFRLLDVDGHALAVLGSSMRGGRSLAGIAVAYDATDPKPAFTVPSCGGMAGYFPDLVRGGGGEIVSVCIDSRFDNPKCVRPLRGDGDRCLRVAAVALDGKDLAPAVKGRTAAVQRVECGDAGHPRLVLDGGAVIELRARIGAATDFAPQSCAR